MLKVDSTFPYAGSFALYRDPTLPPGSRGLELARILERDGDVALISLPLRIGANGNRRVPIGELIDGTPLSAAEEAELNELGLKLRSRSRNRRKIERAHLALRSRAIHQIVMRAEKAKWAAAMLEARRIAA